jgi:iron(III) transport system substrate-binding protein
MQRRDFLGGLGSLLGAGALAAPSTAQEAKETWPDIEREAAREGAATLYHTFSPSGMPDIISEFNKVYPKIRVTELRLSSQQFYQRFATEYRAGKLGADVCANAMDDAIRTWHSSGWIEQWSPPDASGIPASMSFDSAIWAVQLVRQMIAYNSKLVSAANAPQEWSDLVDAKWKGKVGLSPPWRAIGPLQAINFIEKKLSMRNSAELFKAVNVRFFEGAPGVLQALIRGDVQVAQLADLLLNPVLEDGAPIGIAYPKSGVVFTTIVMFVPRPAKRPNAGRVLANWLMSKKGQVALQQYSGSSGARVDIDGPSRLPANRDLNLVDGDALTSTEDRRRIVEEWRRVFNVN